MSTVHTPPPVQPGAFGLARIRGVAGRIVGAMQGAAGRGSEFEHAFLVLDNNAAGVQEIIEAEPGPAGAVIRPLSKYLDMQAADPDSVVFCDAPIRRRLADYGGGDPDGHVEAALRRMVVAAGRQLEATPYSLLDYASLAALHSVGRPEWLRRYVADSGHLICSQLVDVAFHNAGIRLFTDDRFAGDVMPADLDGYRIAWLEELAGRVAA